MKIVEWLKSLFKKDKSQKKEVSDSQKKRMVAMAKKGITQQKIAKKFETSQSLVSRVVRNDRAENERKANERRAKKRGG